MNLFDAMKIAAAIDDVKRQIADAEDLEVGKADKAYIPGANRLAALLVRGKDGRRVRITGVVYEREK